MVELAALTRRIAALRLFVNANGNFRQIFSCLQYGALRTPSELDDELRPGLSDPEPSRD